MVELAKRIKRPFTHHGSSMRSLVTGCRSLHVYSGSSLWASSKLFQLHGSNEKDKIVAHNTCTVLRTPLRLAYDSRASGQRTLLPSPGQSCCHILFTVLSTLTISRSHKAYPTKQLGSPMPA